MDVDHPSYLQLTFAVASAMATHDSFSTTVSTTGQVILPKALRAQLQWHAGTRLLVEQTEDGLLLKAAPVFPVTRPEDVFGCLAHAGPPKSLEEMDAAVLAEARRRHDRNRY